ncbi:MAG: hypothetical protein ABUT11_00955 [Leifsonia sp.]
MIERRTTPLEEDTRPGSFFVTAYTSPMRRRIASPAILGALAALVVGLSLSGCTPPAQPVALKVAVYQLRSDYAIRGAQIEITNRSPLDLQITSATFDSAWFAKAVSSPSAPNQLLAKSTTDFRITLASGRCDAARSAPIVHLRYTRPDGSTGTAKVVPSIPFDSISIVHAQDCAQQDFEKVATISIAPALRFDPPAAADGRRSALLDLTFTPTGAPGSVTLRSTEDTTLLAQREGPLRTIDLTLTAASPPTTVTLDFVPEGCLQHRIAEDKIGTLIPLHVDAGPYHNALFSVSVSPAVKNALFTWVGEYCGW